ncbi:MAG: hybrid sensor histidine kinase/response regulator [Alphaproteobacteria bacterium]|nr:hybrid sensor histidine kinase/response regulator [Alphaproteobacteria bacterium]
MDDLLRDFLTETNENLGMLDTELVKLEQNPNDPGLVSSIFRMMHTIKGTCGFLGLPRLEKVAHAGENLLDKIRDKELVADTTAVSLILESIDRIKSLLSVLEQTEAEPEGEDSDLIQRLNDFAAGKGAAAPAAAAPASPVPLQALASTPAEPEPDEHGFVPVPAHKTAAVADAIAAEKGGATPAAPPPVPVAAAPAPAPVAAAAKPPVAASAAPPPAKAETAESAIAASSIRVNVDVLENLMTMVSELVLTRNQLLQILRSQKDSEFAAPLQRLNHVTSELQEGVMKTRMQPIGNAWSKLPRLIRDLSHELGKKIDLLMHGQETELDRQVLELIKDPLTHLVRNCADHGLEPPDERRAAGKPETGKVILNAFHEGGHIIIEIKDDGRGLNIDRIKQKAVQNGVASEAEIAAMSDQQAAQFIFAAGFSTAAQVTSVSGRGVGMDVVRTNIEKIGGTVELKFQRGKGTAFVIKIPLTLAIVSALIVECSGERFAIPQISVLELVRAHGNSETTVERVNDAPFLRLRNRLLPLVSLHDTLRLGETRAMDDDKSFIVVTQVGNYTFGIMVDRVFDTEEIVVKPVAPILRDIPMFSGNTILGDGSVIMILDPNGIAAGTGASAATMSEAQADQAVTEVARSEGERVALLVFRAGGQAPKAVPLSLIARLEETDAAQIEYSDGKPVLQYRGKLMPLVTIDPNYGIRSEGRQPILVFADRNRNMGLLVDEIVDIVEERLSIEMNNARPGMVGSAIISGKATDVIDTAHYLAQAFGDWFGKSDQPFGAQTQARRLLLVDDSPFFRNLLQPILQVAGYDVTTADTAAQALTLCESGREFDVIVSDIEMPGMSGFDFAETLRRSEKFRETPILALSSHTHPADIDRARRVGFTDFIPKLDREGLLASLSELGGRSAAE